MRTRRIENTELAAKLFGEGGFCFHRNRAVVAVVYLAENNASRLFLALTLMPTSVFTNRTLNFSSTPLS
jgi:hypothetical protein